jgi:hypothetical protein
MLLLAGRSDNDMAFDEHEHRDLARVVAGVRQIATADQLVWKGVLHLASRPADAALDLPPLIAWVLQLRPVDEVCRSFGLSGRRALEAHLRAALTTL